MSFTTARVTAAIDAAVEDTTHIQLHDGDPGSSGTDNVASVASRTAFVFPAASNGETEQTVEIEITGATDPGSPLGYATGWNAASNGTHQWTAPLSPAESFAGAGTLEVTVTATASNA